MNPDELDNVTIEEPIREESIAEESDADISLSISADTTSISEGNDGDTTQVGFDLNLSQSLEQDLTINLNGTVSGNGESTSNSGQVTIFAGETTARFDVIDIQGDGIPEENETITANITSADESIVIFSPDPVTITVQDDDGGGDEISGEGGETPAGEDGISDSDGNTVYRFFNPTEGVHFYTADENERAIVESEPNNVYDFEGASYLALDPLTGNSVYRFFNTQTGVHLYTTDENERDFIQDNLDVFSFEGNAFNAYETPVDGSIPVYRFFEPNIGVHFYTPNETERDFVENELGNYQSEGIAYYALPLDSETL